MSTSSSRLRKQLARVEVSTLLVRARALAAGFASGGHRADRKGSGVEFAGHRSYAPGDDLRHLDRHALLRHKQLLIREFFTDTERSIHLVVDASESMAFRGNSTNAQESPTKLQTALLLAAALAFMTRTAGDRLGLTLISETGTSTVKPRAGRDAFEHILHELESLDVSPRQSERKWEEDGAPQLISWETAFNSVGALVPRGSVIFVLSDFLDATADDRRALAALSTQRRTVRAAQVLTDDEARFPFDGSLRLQDIERHHEVETDADAVRADYLQALSNLTLALKQEIEGQGGSFQRVLTTSPEGLALRALALGVETGDLGDRA